MRPVSARFLASLRQSHLIVSRCTLTFPSGQTAVVPVESGNVVCDRTAQNRRRGTVRIPWSLAYGETLGLDLRSLPMGGYAKLERGLRYPDGTSEYALLGYLRVESVSWGTADHTASIEVADRMSQVRDEAFTAPYAAGGKRPAQAAVEIVQAVFGGTINYNVTQDPPTVMSDVFYSGQRAEALTALEQAAEAESYFDAAGDFAFAPKPAPGTTPVWNVDASATGVMVAAAESLDRTAVYNGVLVEGQADATSAPVSALATYDEPASPIRWGGPFGKVAILSTSSSVQTAAQALSVAQSLLRLRLRQTRSLTLTAAPNPALEAGDTITVAFPDGRVESHLVDAVTTDLGTGAQSVQTRTLEDPATPASLPRMGAYLGEMGWRELETA